MNENAKLVWVTPAADLMVEELARVSNPTATVRESSTLISYLLKHKHWSPFEMASMCLQIDTTRDIGRQLLRHVSFRFQEFSQRYADATKLVQAFPRPARAQDTKNRQNSIEGVLSADVCEWWLSEQLRLQEDTTAVYKAALEKGIAKEVARVVLMEGLTTTRMFIAGNIRSWLHFCQLRMDMDTQLETRRLAGMCWEVLAKQMPKTCKGLIRAMDDGLVLQPQEEVKLMYVIKAMADGVDPQTEA